MIGGAYITYYFNQLVAAKAGHGQLSSDSDEPVSVSESMLPPTKRSWQTTETTALCNISEDDIGNVQSPLSADRKFHLLKHHFKPDSPFQTVRMDAHFNNSGYVNSNGWQIAKWWLLSSLRPLFNCSYHSTEPGVLVTKPMTIFKSHWKLSEKTHG